MTRAAACGAGVARISAAGGVKLVAAMPRVDCPKCGVVVARVPWAEPGSRFTKDFEAECAWLMTVANQRTVSGSLHVSWRTAGAVAHRVAERVKASMPSPFDGLHAIGVDETSHRKGHTYLTVVVDHERHRVTWDHDGYGRDVFGLFFQALTPEQRASIRLVTGDGARWIDSCVDRWCPNVERVLDGFHIVSWMSDALDKVRKRLWNQARRDGDEKSVKRRVEEPRRPDRQTVRGLREPAGHGPQGPALPRMATQGTIEDPAQAPARTGPGRTEPLGVPGVPQPHPRDRRTREENPTPPAGHPAHDPAGLLQRQARGLQQQNQGTIRMAYGFHHVSNLIALVVLRCGGLDIDYHNPRSNPRKQQKPRFCWICGPLPSAFVPSRLTPIMATPITSIENA